MDDLFLFPLPISAFEYYYLCDDRVEYPTTFPFELTFSGRLDRTAFETALRHVLPRHPLLSAIIDLNNGGRPNWVAGNEPPLYWLDDERAKDSPEGTRMDITQSPGLRVIVVESSGNTRVVFEFNHACCDGRGAHQFIEEVLIAYHAAFQQIEPRLPRLEPTRLREREFFGYQPSGWWSAQREVWRTIAFWLPLMWKAPTVLAAATKLAAPQESRVLPFRTAVLDQEQLARLRDVAAAEQVTLNDLLLRDLLLVVARWNRERGVRGGWLRINVPITRIEKRMPAANLISFAFITKRLRAGVDPRRLLKSIARDTERIKRDRTKPYFIHGLTFACGIRGLVPRVLSWNKSFATIVMSNVGTVFAKVPLPRRDGKLVCGGAVLECATGVPPIRTLTRAAIAVMSYAGQCTINLRCDASCFRVEDADKLLSRYVEQLAKTAGPDKIEVPTHALAAQPVPP